MSIDYTQFSDGELAALSLAGRQIAFTEIMRRHRAPIYRFVCAYVADSNEALDITQECFFAAYQALKRYDSDRSFRAWLSAIAVNKCRDWARRRAVRHFFALAQPLDEKAEQIADDRPLTDVAAESRQELKRLWNAVSSLPANLKEPLLLRTVEGLSQAETASALSISEKAVETRLYRARTRLAKILGDR